MVETASNLATSLGRWEIAEYVCAGLVAVACAGEYVAEFTDWSKRGMTERKDRLAKRSTLLLVSALALELICLVKTNTLAARQTQLLQEESKRTDQSLWLTQLLFSPRRISDVNSFASQLKQFKGELISVKSYVDDPDGNVLCRDLYAAVASAGMSATDECGKVSAEKAATCGVLVLGPRQVEETLTRLIAENVIFVYSGAPLIENSKAEILVGRKFDPIIQPESGSNTFRLSSRC